MARSGMESVFPGYFVYSKSQQDFEFKSMLGDRCQGMEKK